MRETNNRAVPNQPAPIPQVNLNKARQSFPARYKNLEQIRDFVTYQAEAYGFDPNEIYAIQVAVDEAFTNIIEHAYGGECSKDIQCECFAAGDEFTVTIIDNGLPFNPDDVPEPDTNTPLEERDIGGLGIHFMRKSMDEVRFSRIEIREQGGDERNQLVMVKRKNS